MQLIQFSATILALVSSSTAFAYNTHEAMLARRAIVEDAYNMGFSHALSGRGLGGVKFPEFMQKGNTNPTRGPSVQDGDHRLDPKPHGYKETLVQGTKENNPQILRDQKGGFLGNDEHSGDSRKAGSGQWMAPSKQQVKHNVKDLFKGMPERQTNKNQHSINAGPVPSLKGSAQKVMAANKAANAFKSAGAGKKSRRALYLEDYHW